MISKAQQKMIKLHSVNSNRPERTREITSSQWNASACRKSRIDEYQGIAWDYIITVCDHANENCPFIPAPAAKRLHHNFSDPSKVTGSSDEVQAAFLKTREEIRDYIVTFVNDFLT